jgi:hypothetical protein
MEMTVLNKVIALLAVLADGTTSLYLSSGTAIIGGGEHEHVRNASAAFVATTNQLHGHMKLAQAMPLPATGHVTFYARTDCGVFMADVAQAELRSGHPLTPLFSAGNAVITELRKLSPTKGKSTA